MEIRFKEQKLDRLETDGTFDAGFSREIVRAYRKCLQIIRSAPDERVFYQLKSLHFEKLKGNRSHQHSMRLNKQWRMTYCGPLQETSVEIEGVLNLRFRGWKA